LKTLDKVEMSVKLNEVTGFIYGSFSTRFWMMRKGINALIVDNYDYNARAKARGAEKKQLEVPFHAW